MSGTGRRPKQNATRIIIYGGTFLAEQFLYQYTNQGQGTLFELCRGGIALVAEELPPYWYGTELITDEIFFNITKDIKSQDFYIYIAHCFASREYKEIKAKLEASGFEEFTNFLSTEAYGKEMVLINVNCHLASYSKYLLASKAFCEKYYIYPIGPIHSRNPVEIPDVVLKNCDLYIHQIISNHNPYSAEVSDEYIYSRLSKDCRKLIVPNFGGGVGTYGRFYFPQVQGSDIYHSRIGNEVSVFIYRDMVIEECLFRGLGIEKMWNCYMDENLIPHEITRSKFFEFLSVLKKAEEKWDVKISDYLENNYKYRIYSAPYHPGKEILAEIGKRILNALEIDEDVAFDWEFVDEYPILSCVSKALGIKQSEFIRDSNGRRTYVLCDKRMDLKEYIRQYIYWVHGYELNFLYSKIYHIARNKDFILYHPTGYMRQVLNIMKEPFKDSLDSYQRGTPVMIMASLLSKVSAWNCINAGVDINDIYMIETKDQRKVELAKLIFDHPKVIIYGMGNDCKYLIDEISEKIAVCDQKVTGDGIRDGIEYMTVDTLINNSKGLVVYITSSVYGEEIRDDLCKKGFPEENIILNRASIAQIDRSFSQSRIVPLVQSQIWEE